MLSVTPVGPDRAFFRRLGSFDVVFVNLRKGSIVQGGVRREELGNYLACRSGLCLFHQHVFRDLALFDAGHADPDLAPQLNEVVHQLF